MWEKCVHLCVCFRRVARKWASWVWLTWRAASGRRRLEQQGSGWKKAATSISKTTENRHTPRKWKVNQCSRSLLSGSKLSCVGLFFHIVWKAGILFVLSLFTFDFEAVVIGSGLFGTLLISLAWQETALLTDDCHNIKANITLMTCGLCTFFGDLFISVTFCPHNPFPVLPSPCSFLQVAQYSRSGYLSPGWPGCREEQEQVCSIQRLCAHLAAQGTQRKWPALLVQISPK